MSCPFRAKIVINKKKYTLLANPIIIKLERHLVGKLNMHKIHNGSAASFPQSGGLCFACFMICTARVAVCFASRCWSYWRWSAAVQSRKLRRRISRHSVHRVQWAGRVSLFPGQVLLLAGELGCAKHGRTCCESGRNVPTFRTLQSVCLWPGQFQWILNSLCIDRSFMNSYSGITHEHSGDKTLFISVTSKSLLTPQWPAMIWKRPSPYLVTWLSFVSTFCINFSVSDYFLFVLSWNVLQITSVWIVLYYFR